MYVRTKKVYGCSPSTIHQQNRLYEQTGYIRRTPDNSSFILLRTSHMPCIAFYKGTLLEQVTNRTNCCVGTTARDFSSIDLIVWKRMSRTQLLLISFTISKYSILRVDKKSNPLKLMFLKIRKHLKKAVAYS